MKKISTENSGMTSLSQKNTTAKIDSKVTRYDIEKLAAMHIDPSTEGMQRHRTGGKFRFFREKLRLFHDFDKSSIIVSRADDDNISACLIYTRDEREFNRFSGPRHFRFYINAIKTCFGFYGCDMKKILKSARSMLGVNREEVKTEEEGTTAKIWALIVTHEYRRRGIGSRLLEECFRATAEKGADKLRITVHTENNPAVALYEKAGFTIIGKCMESTGESYVMEIDLKSRECDVS